MKNPRIVYENGMMEIRLKNDYHIIDGFLYVLPWEEWSHKKQRKVVNYYVYPIYRYSPAWIFDYGFVSIPAWFRLKFSSKRKAKKAVREWNKALKKQGYRPKLMDDFEYGESYDEPSYESFLSLWEELRQERNKEILSKKVLQEIGYGRFVWT